MNIGMPEDLVLRAEHALRGAEPELRGGETRYSFSFGEVLNAPVTLRWDTELWSLLHGLQTGSADDAALRRLGARLTQALPEEGVQALAQAWAAARREGRRLLLRVCSDASEVYALPWELIQLDATPLSLIEREDVVVTYQWRATRSLRAELPPVAPRLAVAFGAGVEEALSVLRTRLNPALSPLYLPLGDPDALAEALVEHAVTDLVVLGHGQSAARGGGVAREEGAAFDAPCLLKAVAPATRTLHAVVLAVCHGGAVDVQTRGVAASFAEVLYNSTLVEGPPPFLLAARNRVSVLDAVEMSCAFLDARYDAEGLGDPRVCAEAVAAARSALLERAEGQEQRLLGAASMVAVGELHGAPEGRVERHEQEQQVRRVQLSDRLAQEAPESREGLQRRLQQVEGALRRGPELQAGDLVGGRFRLEALVGEAKDLRSRVWRAWDLVLEQSVAVKVLNPRVGRDPTAAEAFQAEAQRRRRLIHQGLAAVLEQGVEQEVFHWLAMEYFPTTLRARVLDKSLDQAQLLELIQAVGAALHWLHRRPVPVLHLNLQPSNVLIDELGEGHISDIGTADPRDPERELDYPWPLAEESNAPPETWDARYDLLQLAGLTDWALAQLGVAPAEGPLRRVLDWGMRSPPERRPQDVLQWVSALAQAQEGALAHDAEVRLGALPAWRASELDARRFRAPVAPARWHLRADAEPRARPGDTPLQLETGRVDWVLVQPKGSRPPFAISTTVVTQAVYAEILGVAPFQERLMGEPLRGPELPAQRVSWDDAAAFCNRLSQREGLPPAYRPVGGSTWELVPGAKGYRLPSEQEWRLAASAGTTHSFVGTSRLDELHHYANLMDESSVARFGWSAEGVAGRSGFACLAPVACFLPNRWGLYDLNGNVWEWVDAPFGGPAPLLGGAWSTPPAQALLSGGRSAQRALKHHSIGFRLARTLPRGFLPS